MKSIKKAELQSQLEAANAKAQIRIAAAAGGNVGWGVSGLNRRPTDYESAALTD